MYDVKKLAPKGDKSSGGPESHYPHQGGFTAAECESDGSPGEKMSTPGSLASMSGEDGNHDIGPIAAHAAAHGFPAVKKDPDNISGSIETDEPTKGEGSTPGPVNY